MSRITFKYLQNPHAAGIGSVLQGEILANLVSIYLKFPFQRIGYFFYYKSSKKNKRKWEFIFRYYKNKDNYNEHCIKEVTSINNISKKNKFIYNIPFKISESFLKSISSKEKERITNVFRKKFWKYNKKLSIKNKKIKNIVLHLRNITRYDTIINWDSYGYEYFSYDYKLPNQNTLFYTSWYSDLVKTIIKKNKLTKKNVKIVICTTGKKKSFENLIKKLSKFTNVELRINENAFEDFKYLINADYLILGKSSFSYIASFINKRQKFIRNGFRHILPYDVKIVKDYHLTNYSFISYIYNNILLYFFKRKLHFIRLKKKLDLVIR